MKKTFLSVLAAGLCVVTLLSGCQETTYSNDYVNLGKYKGLNYAPADVSVTDAEVEQQIQQVLASQSTTTEVTDRTDVQDGDTVNIDYVGTVDGTAFDGGTAQGVDLTIGSGRFIPGFEDQLIGAKVGETTTIKVTFPDPYQNNPDLAGKEAEFTVTINKISKTVTPELTDTLVQSLPNSAAKTIDEYRNTVKKQLTDYKQQQADYMIQNTVWQQVMDNAELKKYPEGEVEQYVKDATDYYTQAASVNEMELEDFLTSYYNMTLEDFNTRLQAEAEEVIKREVVVNAIADAEKLAITDEEYKEGVERYAGNYGFSDTAAFEEQYGKEVIMNSLLTEKVMNFVVEHAKEKEGFVYQSPSSENSSESSEDSSESSSESK